MSSVNTATTTRGWEDVHGAESARATETVQCIAMRDMKEAAENATNNIGQTITRQLFKYMPMSNRKKADHFPYTPTDANTMCGSIMMALGLTASHRHLGAASVRRE